MEWMTLASTLVGGGIATVSAGYLERRRWKHDRVDQRIEARRALYGTYLAGLSTARLTFSRLVRDTEVSNAERRQLAWDAFAPCSGLRYQVVISAPEAVATAAEDVYRKLRDLRNAVSEGLQLEGSDYAEYRARYDTALRTLRAAMRVDLGADG
ncbi:hypothetical protein AB0H77_06040 [Streptomyces sp. NPDC050844]|uniref:hypothetical protein n=1 Tax=Streptomyces sp. NPDC050844 TaxID=3155790 RepID=UPI00340258C5